MKKLLVYFGLLLLLLSVGETRAACPGANVNASFTTSQVDICGAGPTTITFTNTSTGANAGTVDYEWYLNGALFDNTTGLVAPINSNIGALGVYTYMLIAIDPGVPCRDTAIVTVVIHPVPVADFSFAPNNVCGNVPINFTNNSTGSDAFTTYNWNFGDGNTSTATDPTHTYGAGGSYNVTLTMTNGPGCTSTFNQTVTTLAIPVVNIAGDDGDGDLTYCLLPGDPTTQETVTFFNTTTGAVNYDWDFGDGSPIVTTGSTAPLTHTYTQYGTFTVTMTATHANGCQESATLTVVFEKFVSAALTLDITEYSGCAPHNLSTLVNLSVNANTYVWDFGDGTVITTTDSIPPNYSYTTGGTYTITLTASNSCNTAVATISPIIIIGGPQADFTQSVTFGCAPQNVTFNNTSTGALPANNYQWDMGNGNTYTNTVTPPAQTYSTTGVYTVEMIAANACGNDTITSTIFIDTIPTVALTVNPIEGCTPLVVESDAVATGGNLNWQWFVDGVFTSTNPDTLADQTLTTPPGNNITTHNIQVNVSNQCGTATENQNIIVHPQVQAIFTANDTICEGQSITFTDASLGDTLSWNWDFGNGNTANTQGPHTETYNTAGTYTVTLTVNGYCGTDVATMTVEVLPIPVADIVPVPASGCESDVFSFNNNSTAGGTYNWDFGPEGIPLTSTAFNPGAISFSDSGVQMVTIVVDVLGCVNHDTTFITVDPLPIPAFTVTPNDGCTPLDVAFTDNSTFTPGSTFDWDFGNGNTSTAQNPPNETYIALANDSIYTVQLIVTSPAGCVDSITQTVTVHPLPIADFTPLPDTACAQDPIGFLNNSVGATSYQWDFGDGNTSTTTSPSHSYANAGNYTIELIAITNFNCQDTVYQAVYIDSIPTSNFNFTVECVGTATQFTDLSTGGITSWLWDFGDGNTSTAQNPAHLYALAGTYNVSLTVTNPANCPITLSQLVVVNSVPVANFTNTPSCLGQNMTFTDQTTGTPVSWEWDFGDGSPVNNNQNPNHTYADTGAYTVQLIVAGGSGCFDTIALPVYVDSIPTADFTFTDVCMNDTTFFVSTSTGGPDTYFWDFDDGNTDATNDPTPDHIYTNDGSYNVVLVAGYAASGCTDTIVQTVTSFPRTVPGFSANTPCLGLATNFTDLTANTPTVWSWDFGDGSPLDNNQNPSHTYATDGFFTVTLITENAFACSDTIQQQIEVYPLPTSVYAFDTVCDGFAASFTDQSISAVAWEWDFGDGSPLDLNTSPQHTFPAAGQYNVQLVVTNVQGCTDTSVQLVDVNPNPVAAFDADTACFSYATQFTDQSAGPVNWEWDFGDGSPINNQQNPAYTYASDGTYAVELTVYNVFGCSDSITQNVLVLPQPSAGFTNQTVCAGDNVAFNDTTLGSPDQWSWDFGDGSPLDNTQNPTHTYNTGGSYTVTLISGNSAGCYDTTAVVVNVYTVPVPAFLADTVCFLNITTFTDLSTDAVPLSNWLWDFGDGINQSSAQNPTYIYQNPGTYNVSLTVTNVNGCDSTFVAPVVVNPFPTAAFSFDTVCVGSPTTFTDQSAGVPTSWTWDFGDGNQSTTGPVVQHTYGQAGSYLVSMIVDGGVGCTDQAFNVITVSDVVAAAITAPDSICQFGTATFDDASTITIGSITDWQWDFGDGSPIATGPNVLHTYNTPGTYTVTLTVTSSGGCVSTATHTLVVNDLPQAAFTANIPCEGQFTNFVDQSTTTAGTIDQWEWNFGDGSPVDNAQNPSHLYALAGTYNVQLIIFTNGGCSDTITQPVQIHPQPNAAFVNDTVCGGLPISFTDQSTVSSGTIANWDWDFGNNTSTLQNPQNSFGVYSDSFPVTLTITTDLGCVDSVTQMVVTLPVVDFAFGPLTTAGCPALSVDFVDSSTTTSGNGIINWLWDFDDGILSFAQNPNHVYTDSGDYYVTLTVTTVEGCTYTQTLTYPVTVYPNPTAAFDASPTVTNILEPDISMTNLSSADAINFEWNFGDNNYSNAYEPIHSYNDTGSFTITLIAYNHFGCPDTATQVVHIEGQFAFFAPNAFSPNGDGVNDVYYTAGFGFLEFKFYIFDRWGQLVFETDNINNGWDGTYRGITAPDDVYVWRVVILDQFRDQHEKYGHITLIR